MVQCITRAPVDEAPKSKRPGRPGLLYNIKIDLVRHIAEHRTLSESSSHDAMVATWLFRSIGNFIYRYASCKALPIEVQTVKGYR